MSKIVATAVIRGARKIVSESEDFLSKAIKEKGEDQRIGFPETAYYLPFAYALLGLEAKTIGDLKEVIREAKSLLAPEPSENLWLPYLGDALDCGIATLLAEEVICALRYLYGLEPQKDCVGFYTDTWQRKYGIQLVDGRMPGFAAILGAAPDNRTAVEIVREFQERNIICFVGSSNNRRSIIDQLLEENVELGWETYIVPYGRDTITAIYPLNWAIRAALTFGGLKKGEGKACLKYCQNRVFAFGLVLGKVDDLKYATGAGAINMGFPIICDTDIPEIRPSGITTYEALVKEFDYKKIISKCIETRGVKIKFPKVDIPVPYAAAFEGERVRRENLYVEFGGKVSTSFEYLKSKGLDEIEDGKIELIGRDIDSLKEGEKSMPLAIIIEVAGRKMQKDFEPILERQIHRFINYCMGVMHIGQRDMNWIRINKEAFQKGLRLKHLGIALHAMLHSEYGVILDKVQVKIYTKSKDVEELLLEAKSTYKERDERIGEMTDESVDTFYSCTLCQSFAPNHICIITPERLGLCGAYSWLDGKASYELAPSGPNQPIIKGEILNSKLGQWKNVNDFVHQKSNKTIEKVSMYSLMDSPQTSCGCFECIVAIIPEVNGFMIVDRDYPDMTPCGMTFTALAGSIGGGIQTPGFLGIGRLYIVSKKFISAEGGIKRIVWMTKELKDYLGERLKKRVEEIGEPDLMDKICDETIAVNSRELLSFLERVDHPALKMEPLI